MPARSGPGVQRGEAERAGRPPLAALRWPELLRRQRHLRERCALRAAGLHHVCHSGALPDIWYSLKLCKARAQFGVQRFRHIVCLAQDSV